MRDLVRLFTPTGLAKKMEYVVKSSNPEKQRSACVIVGIFERRNLTSQANALDQVASGAITAVMRRGDMDGRLGQTLMLHNLSGTSAERVLLVGLGKEREFNDHAYRKAVSASIIAVRSTGAVEAVSYLAHQEVKGRDICWKIRQAQMSTHSELYQFEECRGDKSRKEKKDKKLERVTLDVPRRTDIAPAEAALNQAIAISSGQDLARDLGNLPGNICTPSYLAEAAKKLGGSGERAALKVKILEEADMQKLGMGSLLSVSRGSREPAKLIVMEYMKGKKGDKPIALVGKGLTFDAGGISLKPADRMDEMKFDMCGGAAVIGAMKALVQLKLPINVVGVVAASENMPDGHANKPGDVVTSMAGITIEVLNTDAEGRLILADALTYTERKYEPSVCIDMATLTGACVVALGGYPSGLMSNQPDLAKAISNAGEEIGDRTWELPLWPEYDDHIKSPVADIANIATRNGREGGAIIAATFLHRFTKRMNWAHLDIAGTAWIGKKSTGRPVPLLIQYLLNVAAGKKSA